MHQVYPDEGLDEQLQRILADGVRVHLFVNDFFPDRDTVLADLTEAAWAAYMSVALDLTDFPTADLVSHSARRTGPPVTIDVGLDGDQTAYGYYVTNDASDLLLAVARFDSAPVLGLNGETFAVVPVWGGFSRYSS